VIAVVDAGLGNLRSVVRAVSTVSGSEEVQLVSEPSRVLKATRVVMPGQGAFGDCARALRPDQPLGEALVESIRSGKPYLGICLGLQVLFEGSDESPAHPGLGIFAGRVVRLPSDARDTDGRRLKVPHIGWSRVALRGHHPVLGVTSEPWFYFVHSFHARPADESVVAGVCAFGSIPLTAAVARDNVVGVQFHPEKSQSAGLELLRAFVSWKC
jgi:imidazole glycerol-phosphate synthase subunit HisH